MSANNCPYDLTDDQIERYRPDRVDGKFLTAMGVKIVWHQPWQVSLFHPDSEAKFVWYPGKGTLMLEPKFSFGRKVPGKFTDSEDVYDYLVKLINEQ